ncbi:hypothetical protein [Gimesia algae]|nr:hypothetical protein [Gimesia algae]
MKRYQFVMYACGSPHIAAFHPGPGTAHPSIGPVSTQIANPFSKST